MNEKRKQRFRLKRLINERCHAAFEQRWQEQGLCPVPQEELEEMEVRHRRAFRGQRRSGPLTFEWFGESGTFRETPYEPHEVVDQTCYDHFLSQLRERAEADRWAINYGQRRLEESGDVEQDARGIWRHADGTFATRDLITLMEGNPFVAEIETRIFEKKEAGLASRIREMLEKFEVAQ